MKLVTWNTQWCCGLDGIVDPKRIVDSARALADFDVLCLQEIAVNYPRLRGKARDDQPARIAQLLPGFEVFFAAAVDEWEGGERRRFGNLIASRLPLAIARQHMLPYPADGGVRSMPRVCAAVTVIDPQLGPVRVMTTHLEFYSKQQRMAQVHALADIHAEYCGHAHAPSKPSKDGSPFQTKVHTTQAILCGDFNFEAHEPDYAVLTQPSPQDGFHDAWALVHGNAKHAPTFRLFDRSHGPVPIACDFVFVSESLKKRVRSIELDSATRVSDHQPVAITLA